MPDRFSHRHTNGFTPEPWDVSPDVARMTDAELLDAYYVQHDVSISEWARYPRVTHANAAPQIDALSRELIARYHERATMLVEQLQADFDSATPVGAAVSVVSPQLIMQRERVHDPVAEAALVGVIVSMVRADQPREVRIFSLGGVDLRTGECFDESGFMTQTRQADARTQPGLEEPDFAAELGLAILTGRFTTGPLEKATSRALGFNGQLVRPAIRESITDRLIADHGYLINTIRDEIVEEAASPSLAVDALQKLEASLTMAPIPAPGPGPIQRAVWDGFARGDGSMSLHGEAGGASDLGGSARDSIRVEAARELLDRVLFDIPGDRAKSHEISVAYGLCEPPQPGTFLASLEHELVARTEATQQGVSSSVETVLGAVIEALSQYQSQVQAAAQPNRGATPPEYRVTQPHIPDASGQPFDVAAEAASRGFRMVDEQPNPGAGVVRDDSAALPIRPVDNQEVEDATDSAGAIPREVPRDGGDDQMSAEPQPRPVDTDGDGSDDATMVMQTIDPGGSNSGGDRAPGDIPEMGPQGVPGTLAEVETTNDVAGPVQLRIAREGEPDLDTVTAEFDTPGLGARDGEPDLDATADWMPEAGADHTDRQDAEPVPDDILLPHPQGLG